MQSKQVYELIVDRYSRQNLLSAGEMARVLEDYEDQLKAAKQYLIFCSKRREEIKKSLAHGNYKLVSLGFDCLTRTVATRWGLKKTKKEGELSLPFDLAVNRTSVIINLLNYDFYGFMDPKKLKINAKKKIYHCKYKTIFNHERDKMFYKDSFLQLRKMYERRVLNFRDLKNVSAPTVFVHSLPPMHSRKEIVDLAAAVDRYFPSQNVFLVILNRWEENPLIDYNALYQESPIRLVYHHEQRVGEYPWHHPLFFSSPQGQKFEMSIVDFIYETLQNEIL